MTDSPLDPGRRAQLDPVLAGVFGEHDAAALAAIAQSVRWVSLPGGGTLFRQGDRGDDVFIVVNGRLRPARGYRRQPARLGGGARRVVGESRC
jgi:CRP-like cAMP-binding protein